MFRLPIRRKCLQNTRTNRLKKPIIYRIICNRQNRRAKVFIIRAAFARPNPQKPAEISRSVLFPVEIDHSVYTADFSSTRVHCFRCYKSFGKKKKIAVGRENRVHFRIVKLSFTLEGFVRYTFLLLLGLHFSDSS